MSSISARILIPQVRSADQYIGAPLPQELVHKICFYLDGASTLAARCVSSIWKQTNQLILQNRAFGRDRLEEYTTRDVAEFQDLLRYLEPALFSTGSPLPEESPFSALRHELNALCGLRHAAAKSLYYKQHLMDQIWELLKSLPEQELCEVILHVVQSHAEVYFTTTQDRENIHTVLNTIREALQKPYLYCLFYVFNRLQPAQPAGRECKRKLNEQLGKELRTWFHSKDAVVAFYSEGLCHLLFQIVQYHHHIATRYTLALQCSDPVNDVQIAKTINLMKSLLTHERFPQAWTLVCTIQSVMKHNTRQPEVVDLLEQVSQQWNKHLPRTVHTMTLRGDVRTAHRLAAQSPCTFICWKEIGKAHLKLAEIAEVQGVITQLDQEQGDEAKQSQEKLMRSLGRWHVRHKELDRAIPCFERLLRMTNIPKAQWRVISLFVMSCLDAGHPPKDTHPFLLEKLKLLCPSDDQKYLSWFKHLASDEIIPLLCQVQQTDYAQALIDRAHELLRQTHPHDVTFFSKCHDYGLLTCLYEIQDFSRASQVLHQEIAALRSAHLEDEGFFQQIARAGLFTHLRRVGERNTARTLLEGMLDTLHQRYPDGEEELFDILFDRNVFTHLCHVRQVGTARELFERLPADYCYKKMVLHNWTLGRLAEQKLDALLLLPPAIPFPKSLGKQMVQIVQMIRGVHQSLILGRITLRLQDHPNYLTAWNQLWRNS